MRRSGFTLVETLVVVAILALLISYLVVHFRSAANIKVRKVVSMVVQQNLQIALGTYYNEFKAYPPDGYDEPVFAPNGRQLKGSACLTYYLAWLYPDSKDGFLQKEWTKTDPIDPENPRTVAVNRGLPFWRDYNRKKRFNKYGEVLDGFGSALRYDNCERYTPNPQPVSGGADPDPRAYWNNGRPFFPRSCDLWSCGPDGGKKGATAEDDIVAGFGGARPAKRSSE